MTWVDKERYNLVGITPHWTFEDRHLSAQQLDKRLAPNGCLPSKKYTINYKSICHVFCKGITFHFPLASYEKGTSKQLRYIIYTYTYFYILPNKKSGSRPKSHDSFADGFLKFPPSATCLDGRIPQSPNSESRTRCVEDTHNTRRKTASVDTPSTFEYGTRE